MQPYRIDIISAVPELCISLLDHSIIKRAREKNIVKIILHNLHDYAKDAYKHIDDAPYGGGAGMVLQCQPIFDCIRKLQSERTYDEVIFLSPDGIQFTQSIANELSMKHNLILLAGHYKGVDQRVRDVLITKEISIGDYVLSGGEIPALVLTDAIVRLLPGAISDIQSALDDSYQDGLLSPPEYTRPAEFEGLTVPEILRSGNHKHITQWRYDQSLTKTKERRPDLLE